jgi:hypothetical protein
MGGRRRGRALRRPWEPSQQGRRKARPLRMAFTNNTDFSRPRKIRADSYLVQEQQMYYQS